MNTSDRSNEAWLGALSAGGPEREAALADLRGIILAGLPYALGRSPAQAEAEFQALIEDTAQETLLRVLAHLDSFEGRSRFTTWAQKIAVRAAYTELRRRHWKDVSLDQLLEDPASEARRLAADPAISPERAAEQASLAKLVQRMLMEELTDRQRRAMTAMMGGMPLEEIAQRMDTERNALYKLLHDARVRLKRRLEREGLTPGEVLALFERA